MNKYYLKDYAVYKPLPGQHRKALLDRQATKVKILKAIVQRWCGHVVRAKSMNSHLDDYLVEKTLIEKMQVCFTVAGKEHRLRLSAWPAPIQSFRSVGDSAPIYYTPGALHTLYLEGDQGKGLPISSRSGLLPFDCFTWLRVLRLVDKLIQRGIPRIPDPETPKLS